MTVTQAANRAAALKRAFTRRLEEIRTDKNMSQEGKDRQIAKLTRDHQQEIRALRGEHEAERDQGIKDAQRRAFGAPTKFTNSAEANLAIEARYYAALDGASGLSKPQLKAALERAMRLGDDVRAKALAAAIVEQEIASPLPVKTSAAQAYFDANPDFVERVNDVIVAASGPSDVNAMGSARATAMFTENSAFHVAAPDELARYSSGDVDKLVADADAMAGA
jgi:hypothetical protein